MLIVYLTEEEYKMMRKEEIKIENKEWKKTLQKALKLENDRKRGVTTKFEIYEFESCDSRTLVWKTAIEIRIEDIEKIEDLVNSKIYQLKVGNFNLELYKIESDQILSDT